MILYILKEVFGFLANQSQAVGVLMGPLVQDAQQHILVDKYSISNDTSSLSICTSTCTGKLCASVSVFCFVFLIFFCYFIVVSMFLENTHWC
jgi:hypothetical protein